jgi:hypothetical protein
MNYAPVLPPCALRVKPGNNRRCHGVESVDISSEAETMTEQAITSERDVTSERTVAFAAASARVPQVFVYSHSTLYYWWPAWLFGFIIGIINTLLVNPENQRAEEWGPESAMGLSYVALLLLLIIVTNVRLRGIYSLVTLISIAFLVVLLAWLGWWDEIARLIPYLVVTMNTGFYLVFSTGLLLIWLMMFFVFDRMTYWRIRPGQMTIEHLIGGSAESFDTNQLRFQKLSSDLFRAVLGLGSGDLQVTGAGPAPMNMSNVLFADRKVRAIERLISVKPDFAS